MGACPWAKYHFGVREFALYGPAMIPVSMTEDDSVYLLTRHTQVCELLDETSPWPNWVAAGPMEIEHKWRVQFTIIANAQVPKNP